MDETEDDKANTGAASASSVNAGKADFNVRELVSSNVSMPKAMTTAKSDFLEIFDFLLSSFVRLIVADVERKVGCGEGRQEEVCSLDDRLESSTQRNEGQFDTPSTY